METSSHGSTMTSPALPAELPADLRGFNWGAFFLQWVWGIRHKVSWAWWSLIPIVNIFIAFKLGFHGNELAWKNCEWKSEIHFDEVEREWTMAGIGIFIIFLLLCSLGLLLLTATHMMHYGMWRNMAVS